ncbi:MAG: NADH-quinone oxidoreductase subunit C [Chloroflexi bacterium]|nr:NADH-quinone oxidoreductase subunit C [Chloroflexota bacterium]
MTVSLSGLEIGKQLKERFPGAVVEANDQAVLVKSESLLDVARYLKDTTGLDFDYLAFLTAVDYYDYFELVYRLASLKHNHTMTLKTRCYGRENPVVPSVVKLWKGADFQERETFDLFGIKFEGHPNMKRIVLWDGFKGHPLRKDYLSDGN